MKRTLRSIWPAWKKNNRQYMLAFDPGKNTTGIAIASHYKGFNIKAHYLGSLKSNIKTLNINIRNKLRDERNSLNTEIAEIAKPYAKKIDTVIIERYQGRHQGSNNEYVNALIFFVYVLCETLMPNADIHLIIPSLWKNDCKKRYYCYNPKKKKDEAEGELLLPDLYYNPTPTRIKKKGITQEIIQEHPLDALLMIIWSANVQKKGLEHETPASRIMYKGKYYYIGANK